MPSTSLQDADKKLVDRYLSLARAFKERNPGRNLVVTCTYRSPEEQWTLYQHGRGTDSDGRWGVQDPAQVVTNLSGKPGHQSLHNLKPARALDVAVCIGGKVTWATKEYYPLANMAAEFELVSGGTWAHLTDYPHLQLPEDA